MGTSGSVEKPALKKNLALRLLRGLALVLGGYVGGVLLLLALENWMVYRPTRATDDWQAPPAPEVQDIFLTSADGTTIHAWWWPVPNSRGALLYCHGNAGNLSHRGPALATIRQVLKESIFIFDYPGYGKSGGKPNEKGCYLAAQAAYDWLVQNQNVQPDQILLYGGSLGGGVAVHLASQKKHRALILIKTFTSLPDVAAHLHPWLPVRWLMRNRFDNLEKISKCRQPVFMIHGSSDRLVPLEQGERLFMAANQPKLFLEVAEGDHNDPLPFSCFEKLRAFLRETANSQAVPGEPKEK